MVQNLKLWKITLLLLLGLFVFLYLFVNTAAELYFAIKNPAAGLHFHFDEAKGRIVIYSTLQQTPADVAGLQQGDEILAVNNTPITSQGEFVRALLNLEIGKTADIKVHRGNQEITIKFASERQVNTKVIFLSLLPDIIFSYTLCLIGVFVLLKKIQHREAQIFYLMLIFWALAIPESFPQGRMVHNLLPFWVREILILPVWPLAVGLLLHFHLIFPFENEIFRKYSKPILALTYAPVILIIPHLYTFIYDLSWGGQILPFGWGIWLSLYFILALFLLGYSFRYAPSPHIKKQTEIMLSGTIVSLGVPFVSYFFPKLMFGRPLPYGEFTAPLIMLWPVTLAYAIVKHRFMNIDFIIKRGVAYALMSGFVVATYFLLVVGVGRLVLLLTGQSSQLVTILATLFIAALFNPVKNRIQIFVERRFYPNRFTYREAIRSFGHQLVNVLDLERLLEKLSTFLIHTMKIQPVVIFWYDPTERDYKVRKLDGIGVIDLPVFTSEEKGIKELVAKQELLDLSPLKTRPDFLSEEERRKWDELKAEIILPLLSKGRLVGFLSIGPKEIREPYYKEDLDLLQSLSDQINISLDNAVLTEELREQDRLKKELEVARRIQLSSLPQSDPQIPGLDISGISVPALEVGGDYYDYIEFTDGRLGVVVGDVSGKGTSAALYMSQLKGILNTASQYHQSLKKLLTEVNAISYSSIEQQSFITLTCGAFDLKKQKCNLVRAGHLPVIYYSANRDACQQLIPKGIGLGLENGKIFEAQIEETEVEFQSGDAFLFYTDGIVEARNAGGDEIEWEFLQEILQNGGSGSALALRDMVISEVHKFTDSSSQNDDMTLVVVKIK